MLNLFSILEIPVTIVHKQRLQYYTRARHNIFIQLLIRGLVQLQVISQESPLC